MSAIDGLPPLAQVVRAHDLAPTKALGQNFLFDLNLTARIARAAGDLTGHDVLEVGPGPGGLTRALLAGGARRVVAIERDARCLPALAEIAAHYPGRLEVVAGDALTLDPRAHFDTPPKIVANLPYNVGTELLIGWLTADPWPPWWHSLTLMFQREVAERIVAGPGSKAYGRLSVLANWRGTSALLFDIPPQAFVPPPKVVSSVVRLEPGPAPDGVSLGTLERITVAAFGQRRKMLRRALAPLGGEALLERAGIDPTKRAETVDIDGFLTLARHLEAP